MPVPSERPASCRRRGQRHGGEGLIARSGSGTDTIRTYRAPATLSSHWGWLFRVGGSPHLGAVGAGEPRRGAVHRPPAGPARVAPRPDRRYTLRVERPARVARGRSETPSHAEKEATG